MANHRDSTEDTLRLTTIPLYKWVLRMPVRQDGYYLIEEREHWVDCTAGDPFMQILKGCDQQENLVVFPYDFAVTGMPTLPDGCEWGIECTFHPRAGVPITVLVRWTDDETYSGGIWVDRLMAAYEAALPHLPGNEEARFVHWQY